jgi:signal transduction histidine kinase
MKKGRVLIVDDEPRARMALTELLRDAGYQVQSAADGFDALARLAKDEPDIVLTDLRMPGMDGLTLLRRLRAKDSPAVSVVVMTAFGAVETAVSAMKEGAADYLVKPIHFDELVLVLEREMERRNLRREAATARARLEAANRDLEAFGRRIAHDLKGPLAPIPLLAHRLKLGTADPVVVRTAESIAAKALQAGNMIDGLLAFSRRGGHDPTAATVAAGVIRDSLEDFAERIADDQVTVESELDAEAEVACAPSLFREVVDNLVGNALNHLKERERRWLRVRLCPRGALVELEVQDSGPGIPRESLDRIFDLFYRVPGTGSSGNGIGLSTVRRIVDAHGGEITVHSVLGEGTSFRARLRRIIRAASSLAAPGVSPDRPDGT